MTCEDFDKPILSQIAEVLSRMSGGANKAVHDETLDLLRQINAKLTAIGGEAVLPDAASSPSATTNDLSTVVRRGVADERLCAHTRNFLQTVLLRLERSPIAA